jgi:hypothetical protein
MALPESLSSIQKAVQLTTDQRETMRPPIGMKRAVPAGSVRGDRLAEE